MFRGSVVFSRNVVHYLQIGIVSAVAAGYHSLLALGCSTDVVALQHTSSGGRLGFIIDGRLELCSLAAVSALYAVLCAPFACRDMHDTLSRGHWWSVSSNIVVIAAVVPSEQVAKVVK